MRRKTKSDKKLAVLTSQEDAAWDVAFEYYANNSDEELTDEQIAELAWKDVQQQFPRLLAFDGCVA